ncbi:Longitudinals lacking protein-like [Armadillidium vulgare]|nr:Longitudinals lacking protein-like [Armadillidium vulgare]
MYYPDENGSPSSSCSERADEHEDLFRTKVQALWQEECFIDVTLACDDKFVKAHKLVLSAYSDYFKRIFSSITYNHHPVVFMNNVSFEVLQAILEFMYCGEVNVAQYNLKAFMKTARSLKIKGLSMEGSDEDERESPPQKKRKNSPGDKQLMHSPPVKKKKSFPLQEQNYYEEEDDELDNTNDAYWDEDSSSMPQNYGMKGRFPQQQQQQRSSQQGFSHHRYENGNSLQERKRNNSFGNSSHSSQQSRSSIKPITGQTTFKGRTPSVLPTSNRGKARMKEDITPVSDQNPSDNEDLPESNLDESFSKSSQTSGSRNLKDDKKPVALKSDLFSKPDLETRLTRFIVYMSQITPLTISQVKTFAWGLDSVHGGGHFDENGPPTNWSNTFRKKYPKMKNILRNYDFLKPNQLSPAKFSYKALGDYLTPIQEIIEAFSLNESPQNFLELCRGQDNIRPARERFIKSNKFSAKDDFASVMICGSASGEKLAPFALFKNLAPDEEFTKKGPSDAMYDQNSTGFFDSDALLKWFEDCFLPRCPESRSEDSPVILLMNSLLPLVSQEMLDMALAENVILLSLMPHLHHACQPMDVSFVRGFRKSLKEKIEANGVRGDELKDSLPSLLTDAYSKKVTANLLKDGFRICGVFPLSIDVNQDDYKNLTSDLGFDLIATKKRGFKRQSKLLPKKQQGEVNTSDEDEVFGEDMNSCYVCGKDYPKNGTKEQQEKWFKCSKKYCTNISCEECLPLNCDAGGEFRCIDCKKH